MQTTLLKNKKNADLHKANDYFSMSAILVLILKEKGKGGAKLKRTLLYISGIYPKYLRNGDV